MTALAPFTTDGSHLRQPPAPLTLQPPSPLTSGARSTYYRRQPHAPTSLLRTTHHSPRDSRLRYDGERRCYSSGRRRPHSCIHHSHMFNACVAPDPAGEVSCSCMLHSRATTASFGASEDLRARPSLLSFGFTRHRDRREAQSAPASPGYGDTPLPPDSFGRMIITRLAAY